MLGTIIVSLAGVSLPVIAGIWLAPERNGQRGKMMLMQGVRGCLRSWMVAAQTKVTPKDPPADRESSSP